MVDHIWAEIVRLILSLITCVRYAFFVQVFLVQALIAEIRGL